MTVEPLRNKKDAIGDLSIGVAFTRSDVPEGISGLRGQTVLEQTFFSASTTSSTARAAGRASRCSSGPGPASIKAEWMRVETERRGESVEDTDLSPIVGEGWYVSGTYAVTGEKKSRMSTAEEAALPGRASARSKSPPASRASSSRADRRASRVRRSPRADTILGNRDQVTTLRRELVRQPVHQGPGELHPREARRSVAGAAARRSQLQQPGHPVPVFHAEDQPCARVQPSSPRARRSSPSAPSPAPAPDRRRTVRPQPIQEIRLSVNSRDLRGAAPELPAEHLLHRGSDVEERQGPQRRHPLARAGQPQPDEARASRRHGALHDRTDVRRAVRRSFSTTSGRTTRWCASGSPSPCSRSWASPVPRESFCRLYINNEYQGLYAITEEIDGDFAKRVTGETDGTVFEFHWANDRQWRAEDLGAIENYKPLLRAAHARARRRQHALHADPVSCSGKSTGPTTRSGATRVEQYLDLEPVHEARRRSSSSSSKTTAFSASRA